MKCPVVLKSEIQDFVIKANIATVVTDENFMLLAQDYGFVSRPSAKRKKCFSCGQRNDTHKIICLTCEENK